MDSKYTGEYEVDGVKGGQCRTPEEIIATAKCCCVTVLALALIGAVGIIALIFTK